MSCIRTIDGNPILRKELEALADQGYYLGRKIGSGSFANVYIATHRTKCHHSIKLACKLFDLNSVPLLYREKFFPRELKFLIAVSHPNIICMHSIQQIRSKVFIFMRFEENGDLLQYTQEYGAVDETQSRYWFRQIVSALEYLHSINIAHRDLKCENILLSKNYNVKLADFGFAREFPGGDGQRLLSRTFCGSAAYSAPEIICGRPYNPMIADVWSLGVVLFILLNGEMPFDDSNTTQLLRKQLRKSWTFKKSMRRFISSDVKKLIRHLLEPDITKRLLLQGIVNHPWLKQESGDRL